jgi:uncharacterized protein (DUF1778 family)
MELNMLISKVEEQKYQTDFVLSAEQWQAFTEALDQPARYLPRLKKLVREPSILEITPTAASAK